MSSEYGKAIYAYRGNLREARYARMEERNSKADWHMKLAAQYRVRALAADRERT
jgi:hypothetical protein